MGIQVLPSDPSHELSQVILEFNFSCGFLYIFRQMVPQTNPSIIWAILNLS